MANSIKSGVALVSVLLALGLFHSLVSLVGFERVIADCLDMSFLPFLLFMFLLYIYIYILTGVNDS